MIKYSLNWFQPFRNKFQVIYTLSLLIILFYFVSTTYRISINNSKESVLGELKSTVCTAALNINAEKIKRLSENYPFLDQIKHPNSDSVYSEVSLYLREIQEINKLETPLYIVEFNDEKKEFEFLVTSATEPYWRHPYKKFPDYILENFELGGQLDIHESENGKWLSAFAPIKNKNDETIALLMADKEFNSFLSQARTQLFLNSGVSLAIFIILISGLFMFLQGVIKKEENFKQKLQDRNNEIRSKNQILIQQKSSIQQQNDMISKANQIINKKNLELKAANKHLDEKVKLRTADLEKARDNVNRLLYRSSHDLLGPISSMKGLIYLLNKTSNPEDTKLYNNKLGIELGRLDKTVRSIDIIYRLQNETFEIKPESIAMCINNFFTKYPDYLKKVEISKDNSNGSDKMALLDEEILFPILKEILDNGIEYGDKGVESVMLEISMENDKSSIYIKSPGKPVSNEVASNMFDMFYRGTSHSKGAGLGLYIAKLGLEKLKATINYSHKDGYNIFDIRLMAVPTNIDFEAHTQNYA